MMLLRKRKTTLFWGVLAISMIIFSILVLFASPIALFANGGSWSASYWNNRDLSGNPVLVRQESAIDHDWKGLSPDPVVNVDNFSARWVRTYNFAAGTYRFKASMDDGMRVWVDGMIIIDEWTDGKVRTVEAEVQLNNGPHKITVEYYEAGGKAVAGFTWEPVSGNSPPPGSMPPPPGSMPPPTMPMPPSGDVIYPVGVVKSPYLNMRSGAGTNYPVVAVLQQGTEVYIIARSSGSTWYLVQTHGGPTGWVKRYYIHTDFPYTSLPYAESMQKPAPMPPSNPSMQPMGVVNSGALNVRSGPGTNYRTIAVVSGGTNVLLIGRSSGGSWLKIKIPTGTVGWVNGYYIDTSYPTQNLPVG
jgi:uncharacterized protein YraI